MKRFGKILVMTLCMLSLSIAAKAQDLGQATETFNNAATALNAGNHAEALAGFKSALTMAEALGAEGTDIANDSKNVIPQILVQIAKGEMQKKNYTAALAKLGEASVAATEYGVTEVVAEAKKLKPQMNMAYGNALLSGKKYAEAAAKYEEIVADNPKNGLAYVRLGMAKARLNDEAGALAAFAKASEFGQKSQAEKQVSNLHLQKAQAAFKAEKFDEAIKAAKDCIAIGENSGATYIMAMAYVKKKDYPAACVELKKIQNESKYKKTVADLMPQLKCQ